MSKKYVVEFTREQLTVMARGLEFYSRFLAGQWEIPDTMIIQEFKNQDKYDGFWEKRNYVEKQLKILKSHFTGLPLNASYGIGSEALFEDAKIAYDTYRPVWEQFAKEHREDNPEDRHYCTYDYPGLQYGKEGKIKVEVRDKDYVKETD